MSREECASSLAINQYLIDEANKLIRVAKKTGNDVDKVILYDAINKLRIDKRATQKRCKVR